MYRWCVWVCVQAMCGCVQVFVGVQVCVQMFMCVQVFVCRCVYR